MCSWTATKTMANYTLGVVAYVDRQKQIEYLRNEVYPDLIEVDDGTYGVMGNHCLTLEKLYENGRRSGREWIVVLEDDAQPVPSFHRQLSAALDAAPSRIVSLYNGCGHPAHRQQQFADLAKRADVHWITHQYFRHAVAYAIHVDVIELGLIDHMIAMSRNRWAPDDAISKFARSVLREPVAYSNPSLVDHEDGPTMVKGRTSKGIPMLSRRRPRKAHWVGTRLLWSVDNVGQV